MMATIARSAAAATVLALGLAGTGAVAVPAVVAQAGGQPMPLMMMVGCVEGDEANGFHLARVTEPQAMDDRIPAEPPPDVPLGERSIRLIGTLYEFGVSAHVGHKVWAKGMLIEDDRETRLNLVSITHLAPACE